MTQVVASDPDSCYFHFKYFFSDLKQVYDSKVIQVMSTIRLIQNPKYGLQKLFLYVTEFCLDTVKTLKSLSFMVSWKGIHISLVKNSSKFVEKAKKSTRRSVLKYVVGFWFCCFI